MAFYKQHYMYRGDKVVSSFSDRVVKHDDTKKLGGV